jgi:hypothetical protein
MMAKTLRKTIRLPMRSFGTEVARKTSAGTSGRSRSRKYIVEVDSLGRRLSLVIIGALLEFATLLGVPAG